MFLKDLQKNNFQSGFTLIEIILYIAIVVVVISAASVITFNLLFDQAKVMGVREVTQNARFVLEKISREIRGADSIVSPDSGETDSRLEITKEEMTIIFKEENGVLKIKRGGDSPIALTTDEVKISELNFSNVSYSETPGTVRIHLKLNFGTDSKLKDYEFKENFYTTANLK